MNFGCARSWPFFFWTHTHLTFGPLTLTRRTEDESPRCREQVPLAPARALSHAVTGELTRTPLHAATCALARTGSRSHSLSTIFLLTLLRRVSGYVTFIEWSRGFYRIVT